MGYTKAERHRGGFFYRARGLVLLCPLIFLCLSCDNPVLNDELAGHKDGAERMINDPTETCPIAPYTVVNVPAADAAYKIKKSMKSDIRYSFVLSGKLTNACIIVICGALDPKEYNNVNIALDMRECTGLEELPVEAFGDCETLTSVVLPKSIKRIGKGAFRGCSGLTSVEIPDSVTDIGDCGFYACSSLTTVEIPDSVTTIGTQTFSCCYSLLSITLPAGVTSVGKEAFYACDKLETVKILNDAMSIDDTTFCCCTSLKTVNIPASVTAIGNNVFAYCRSLESVNIPASVTSIGNSAFRECSSLRSVAISGNVTNIEEGAFSCCKKLSDISVNESNAAYKDIDGVLFTKDIKTLVCYPAGKTDTVYSIPTDVTTIDYCAFARCHCLQRVTISESVVCIEEAAFYDCNSLREVIFSDPEGWYRTSSEIDWRNKTGGTAVNLSDPSANAGYLTGKTVNYWYKK